MNFQKSDHANKKFCKISNNLTCYVTRHAVWLSSCCLPACYGYDSLRRSITFFKGNVYQPGWYLPECIIQSYWFLQNDFRYLWLCKRVSNFMYNYIYIYLCLSNNVFIDFKPFKHYDNIDRNYDIRLVHNYTVSLITIHSSFSLA